MKMCKAHKNMFIFFNVKFYSCAYSKSGISSII